MGIPSSPVEQSLSTMAVAHKLYVECKSARQFRSAPHGGDNQITVIAKSPPPSRASNIRREIEFRLPAPGKGGPVGLVIGATGVVTRIPGSVKCAAAAVAILCAGLSR